MECDVLIIGAGPAGMSAALEAETNGLDTVLIDASFSLGGHLKYQTQMMNNLPSQFENQRGTTLVKTLEDSLLSSKVTILLKHTMIGTYKDGSIGVSDGKHTFSIHTKKVIISTGFSEEAHLFPGWTKPGVMTVGAAQVLINYERVLPGKNALIQGSNDFSLEVAKQLKACGVNIQGIIEDGNALISNDKELIQEIISLGIPLFLKSSITEVQGAGEVKKVIIDHAGAEVVLKADLICVGKGVTPIVEPFELMGCDLTYKEKLGGFVPKYSENLETSVQSVYIAGKAAGITCLGADLLSGQLAAVCLAASLKCISSEESMKKKKYIWKELIDIESRYASEVSAARLSLIHAFHHEKNEDLITLTDFIPGVL